MNPISIVPYNPSWVDDFAVIAEDLRFALEELALSIDHIGSTSVPGLEAKDVIDIQVTVAEFDEEIIDRLERIGYQYAGPEIRDHVPPGYIGPDSDWLKMYFRPPVGQRATHLHVRTAGRPNQHFPILFRDYLRAHPDSAAAYGELKRRLADHLADSSTYPDVKDPAVDLIYFAAREWEQRERDRRLGQID